MPSAALAVPYPDEACLCAPLPLILAEPFLFIMVRYRGVPIGSHLLSAFPGSAGPRGRFTVGLTKRAQAPADPSLFGDGQLDHDLLMADGAGFRLSLPAAATLIAQADEQAPARAVQAEALAQPFRLGPEGLLSVELGAISIQICRAEAPSRLALASWLFAMNRAEVTAYSASFLFLAMWVLIFRLMPADAEALSFDLMETPRNVRAWTIIPAQLPPLPAPGSERSPAPGAGDPKKTAAEVGSHVLQRSRVFAPRPQNPKAGSPTSEEAVAAARTAGLLGILRPDVNRSWAAVTGRGDPLGDDAEQVLHDLRGPMVAANGTPGGLGVSGTGSKGAGTGGGLQGGGGDLLAIKDGVSGSGDRSLGRGLGRLAHKHPATIDVVPCEASRGCSVAGSLSKEIIRRTIRRHINEVRYCYEQALPRKPTLAGRLVVSFVILPQGTVTAAALAQDTLGDAAVGACVLQATRRWPFPQPEGGGLVKVSYPFSFTAAGGAD